MPGGHFELPIPGNWNSIIYTYKGDAKYQNSKDVKEGYCCVLEQGEKKDEIKHSFTSEKGAKFVLIGGQPLNEPIQQHGPFVMNTKQELYQTFQDYQSGQNGFENADQWESKIKDMIDGKKYEEL